MDALIQKLFSLLDKYQFKIATAESCTGGMIAYSNEAKIEMLDVQPMTLDRFGAVSEQTARLMARGAYAHSLADITVSVTGIAGPDGGSDDKPVGLVYIGLSTDDHAEVHKHVFDGDRASVRAQTMEHAIQHVIDYLESL